MDEQQAFLDTIESDPANDALKLVYADWLEEHAGTIECHWCRGSGEDRPPGPFDDGKGKVWIYRGPLGPCPLCNGARRLTDGRREQAELIRLQAQIAETRKQPGWVPDLNELELISELTTDGVDLVQTLFRMNNWERENKLDDLRYKERRLVEAIQSIPACARPAVYPP
jgi:uncharacterized protein (TIGR02996 family)